MENWMELPLALQLLHILLNAFIDDCFAQQTVFYIENFSSNSTTEKASLAQTIEDVRANVLGNSSGFKLSLVSYSEVSDLYTYASHLNRRGVGAILDSHILSFTTCTFSMATGIPLIRTRAGLKDKNKCERTITLTADYTSRGHATVQLLDMFSWIKIALMYEEHKFHEAVHFKSLTDHKKYETTYIPLRPRTSNGATSLAMKQLAASSADVVLLYADPEYAQALLALEACNPNKFYVWILHNQGFKNLHSQGNNVVLGFQLAIANSTLQDTSPLDYDALTLVAMTTERMIKDGIWSHSNTSGAVESNRKSFYRIAKQLTFTGKSGYISFDGNGKRIVKHMNIVNLQLNKFIKVGEWIAPKSIELRASLLRNIERVEEPPTLQGRKLSVVTLQGEPQVKLVKDAESGEQRYIGFSIDILKELAKDLKFTYEIHEPADKMFGVEINGSWNGMIRELLDGKADMIVSDLTITSERERVIDFTVAFMYYTDKMIMKRKEYQDNDFLQFMSPFTHLVWVMLLVWVIIITLGVFVINYYSPYGYKNHHGVKTAEEFSMFNSLWFSIACVLQQGPDNTPRSLSGRVLAGFYWFSILIWVSTYTANLAAFFTVTKVMLQVNNLEQAVDSTFQIGVVNGTNLYSLFRNSKFSLYQRAWAKMKELPNNNSQGYAWARTKNYIHVGDGPLADFEANKQPCDLVTRLAAPKSYGFAMRRKDPYLDEITLAILRMRENSVIDSLKRKWWDSVKHCDHGSGTTITRKQIDLRSMAGVYTVLLVGMAMAFVVLVMEIWWYKRGKENIRKTTGTNKRDNSPAAPGFSFVNTNIELTPVENVNEIPMSTT